MISWLIVVTSNKPNCYSCFSKTQKLARNHENVPILVSSRVPHWITNNKYLLRAEVLKLCGRSWNKKFLKIKNQKVPQEMVWNSSWRVGVMMILLLRCVVEWADLLCWVWIACVHNNNKDKKEEKYKCYIMCVGQAENKQENGNKFPHQPAILYALSQV